MNTRMGVGILFGAIYHVLCDFPHKVNRFASEGFAYMATTNYTIWDCLHDSLAFRLEIQY